MKISLNDLTRTYKGMGKASINSRENSKIFRNVMVFILVVALAACSRPQQASSGVDGSAGGSDPNSTPTTSGNAGEAVLNLQRELKYYYSPGTDIQTEVGAIPIKFTTTTETGDLIVEGTGKTIWTEIADLPKCKFTATAEGKVTVTGIFSVEDCKLHLTIATKLSQPTTTNQSAECSTSIVFSQTEFSSQIVLDPQANRFNEIKHDGWWGGSNIKLSDLKSNAVNLCFIADVLE